jgi:acetolactate synthase-1/2/3 large subunit
MKASDFIAEFIEQKGITSVFELSGGMITHILDSFNQKTKVQIVTMHHEQSAAFAAEGYARITGLPGVALATSGPGATNLLTGIGSCYFDSTPAIFITGQVNRHELKGSREIRQLGFQETDIVTIAKPITKYCIQVTNPEELPQILENAYQIALEGRPGPVLVDIPMDVQRAQINVQLPTKKPSLSIDLEKSILNIMVK